jgi:hypothetical protein
LEIVVERVNRGASGPVWLFSRKTLDAIPDVYREVDLVSIDRFVPRFLMRPRIAGVRLFAWLLLLLVFPVCYYLAGLIGQLLSPLIAGWRRRRGLRGQTPANVLHGSIRLLLLAVLVRSSASSRFACPSGCSGRGSRRAWSSVAWSGGPAAEQRRRAYTLHHMPDSAATKSRRHAAPRAASPMAIAITAGGLVMLHYVGIDPTAALPARHRRHRGGAGRTETLENVIGGLPSSSTRPCA